MINRPVESLLDSLESGDGSAPGGSLVPVLMPVALDQTYDYRPLDGVPLTPGSFVLVPFGPQTRVGIVWDAPLGPQKPAKPEKLKTILSALDVPPLPEISLRFAEWIAKYTPRSNRRRRGWVYGWRKARRRLRA